MPKYDFKTLSHMDFEDLVRDLVQKDLGVRVESFATGRDEGIDLRYAPANRNEIIVQAKHYANSKFSNLISAVKSERVKVDKLGPERFILATSCKLTPKRKSQLAAVIGQHLKRMDDIIGCEDLNNLLTRFPEVETSHFKLWMSSTAVLKRILNHATYIRSKEEAIRVRRSVEVFAHNQSVKNALDVLNDYHCLIVSGAPGVGKTTLARVIAWLHMQDDWQLISIESFDEALNVIDGSEKQIFFFDDFLGQIRVTPEAIRQADTKLVNFIERVQTAPRTRFVLTTRDHILNQAAIYSEKFGGQSVELRRYILNMSSYTRDVRAKILYNHLYFSSIPSEYLAAILKDDYFLKILDHKNFNPRLIEFITDAANVSKVSDKDYRVWVQRILENPAQIWAYPFRQHLRRGGRALVATMFFLPDSVKIGTLEKVFKAAYLWEAQEHKFETDPNDFRDAMREIGSTFIQVVNGTVSFSNPSLRDFLDSELVGTPFVRYALLSIVSDEQISEISEHLEAHPSEYSNVYRDWIQEFECAASALASMKPTKNVRVFDVELSIAPVTILLQRVQYLLKWWRQLNSPKIADVAVSVGSKIVSLDVIRGEVSVAIQTLILAHQKHFDGMLNIGDLRTCLTEAVITKPFREYRYLGVDDMNLYKELSLDHPELVPPEVIQQLKECVADLVDDIDDELERLGSSSQLEEFTAVLEELALWSDVSLANVESKINDYQSDLEEKEASDEYDYEGASGGYRSSSGTSDKEIRDVFATLRD